MADSVNDKRRRQREEEAQRRLEEMEERRRRENQDNNRDPLPNILDGVGNEENNDDEPVLERDEVRREREAQEKRIEQDRKQFINGLEIIDQNEQSSAVLLSSPMLKLIRFDNIQLDYNINNSVIQNINIQFNYWYQKRLEIITDDLYNTFFDFEASRLNVNRRYRLLFVYNNTNASNYLLVKREVSYLSLKQRYELNLEFSVRANPQNNFQKTIYVYEIDESNKIVGKAKLFFGKRKITFDFGPLL